MQAIAKEMNFSETTFVLPAETPGTDVRMRIFTPAEELPTAGHPTIGHVALARRRIDHGRKNYVFGCGIGPVAVARPERRRPRLCSMTQSPPTLGDVIATWAHGGALSVLRGDRRSSGASRLCGVPFLRAFDEGSAVDGVT
jgi:PhzF family phenazine biosynthesis protein